MIQYFLYKIEILSVHGRSLVRHEIAAQSNVQGAWPCARPIDADRELGTQFVRHIRRAQDDYGERWHDCRKMVVARRTG